MKNRGALCKIGVWELYKLRKIFINLNTFLAFFWETYYGGILNVDFEQLTAFL